MNTRKRNQLMIGMAVVMAVAGITYACKDFLNTTSQGTLDETSLANRTGVEGLLIAAYRSLDCSSSSAGSWGCAASNWVWGSVTSGDAYKGSNLGDQQPINDIETYLWSVGEADDYINQKWAQVFEGVSRANATLRLLDKVVAEKPTEIPTADANSIRGEATFLRAHYEFEAYRMWGNVPYYHETDTDFRLSNQGVDVIGNILSDLDAAIALLPAVARDKGRASSWTAKAYKGRVQVYAGQYAAALTTLREVQATGPFALETSFDHVWTGNAQYENGPETILAFQASVKDGEPSGWNSNWGERLNFPHEGSHFGCCGFHQPSQNLVNFFAVDANGLPLALTDPNWNANTPAYRDTNFVGGITSQPVDPRLDFTVGRDRTPYKNWGLHNRTWIRDASYSGPYSTKKNVQEDGVDAENNVGWQATQTNDVNIHIFRYADMLLLLAEAEVEAGVLENARTIVNQIRARAGQTAQGCGHAASAVAESLLVLAYPTCAVDDRTWYPMDQSPTLDSLNTPWATYKIGQYPGPWTDQAAARTAVRYERRLELAMEGQRFFDLRRWGAADTTINNYLSSETPRRGYLALAAAYAARHNLYPIPSVQIQLSKVGTEERLVQNPGW
jgi:hypothetical protein